MTPEERRLLYKTHELAEENNVLLRKLDKMYRLSRFIRVSYWVVIITLTLGAYYFVQPYVDNARTVYTSVIGDINNLKAIRDNIFNRNQE